MYLHSIIAKRPKNIITNKFLEDLDIGTDENWILERTGIIERRTVLPLDYIKQTKNKIPSEVNSFKNSNYELGAYALKEAVAKAGISLEDLDLIIGGSTSPSLISPCEAIGVANYAGINPWCFDISSGCSNFVSQTNIASSLLDRNYIALVNNEFFTKNIDYSDRRNAILFGDTSVVAIVSNKIPSKFKIEHSYLECDPVGMNTINIDRYGYFSQDGNKVQKFAIQKMGEVYNKLASSKKSYFIGHQANLLALNSIVERNNIENHLYNVNMFGNTAAAGGPAVLADNLDSFKTNDEIIISVCGVGLAWGGVRIKVG